MAKTRYSAHVQLQYLLQKYNIKPYQLHQEMLQYYSHPKFVQHQTASNKVTWIQHQPDIVTPPLPQPKTIPNQNTTKITVKRKKLLHK